MVMAALVRAASSCELMALAGGGGGGGTACTMCDLRLSRELCDSRLERAISKLLRRTSRLTSRLWRLCSASRTVCTSAIFCSSSLGGTTSESRYSFRLCDECTVLREERELSFDPDSSSTGDDEPVKYVWRRYVGVPGGVDGWDSVSGYDVVPVEWVAGSMLGSSSSMTVGRIIKV